MASSLTTSKLLPGSVSIFRVRCFSSESLLESYTNRRGYAATADPLGAVVARGGPAGKVLKDEKSAANKGSESAWSPDPITGHYRPGNSPDEIDPVELRQMLLNNRVKSN